MPQRTGLLGLGSNVGARRAHLQAAVDALPGAGVLPLASSSTYDTDPVGEVLAQPSFLNACVSVQTELEPLALLDAVKLLERDLGRAQDSVRHGPRTIDIDVLLLGEVAQAFEDFRYTDELAMDGGHALIFRALVAGTDREIEGIDLLRFDEDGLIADFTVMLRPLSGLVPFAQAMGEKVAGAGLQTTRV